MSLADDLLKKSLSKNCARKEVRADSETSRFKLTGKYVDESGDVVSIAKISEKYGVSNCKVRRMFREFGPVEAYNVMNTDLRANNHRLKVYKFNDGSTATAERLGIHYGVSKSHVQRSYRRNNKNYTLANKEIEKYINDRHKKAA